MISPQSWGKMFLSKHHYALELAKLGNKVYFLSPPDQRSMAFYNSIRVNGKTENLFLIDHQLFFPYSVKFKSMPLFHWLMRFHVKNILKRIGEIDIVWSFDIGNLYPLPFFASTVFKIYHPVDEPESKQSIKAAEGANIIFSVTAEILKKYELYSISKRLINHGLSSDFLIDQDDIEKDDVIRIGYSGNLLRKDIDRRILLSIVQQNERILFNFWGAIDNSSNIGATLNDESSNFINSLKKYPNVILHGQVDTKQLAKEIQSMDAFLICYDIRLDQSKGTNYHKIMEYLSTGKVVISNNVTAYNNMEHLVQMPLCRDNNDELPNLFNQIMRDLKFFNSHELTSRRKAFAKENLYKNHVLQVEKDLDSVNIKV